jgi:hypothetical protein
MNIQARMDSYEHIDALAHMSRAKRGKRLYLEPRPENRRWSGRTAKASESALLLAFLRAWRDELAETAAR